MQHKLFPLLFFLCFIRMPVEGLGSFLILDMVSVVYFMVWPGRIVAYLPHFRYLAIAIIGAITAVFITGTIEFEFLGRMGLVFLDACFISSCYSEASSYSVKNKVIQDALLGYLSAALVWISLPEGIGDFFYFDIPKAWVATFPALLVVYFIVNESYKIAFVVGIFLVALSINPEIASRTLLMQTLLLTIYVAWKFSRKLTIILVFCVLGLALMASGLRTNIVDNQEHSNTFRLVMITQIFDFSPSEWLFGRGIEPWRHKALDILYLLPGAEEFFETANPHFLPAELIIRGGLIFLISVASMTWSALRRSPYRWIALLMMIGTFTTTNTGVERLYLTLAFSLVLIKRSAHGSRRKWQARRIVQFPVPQEVSR